MESASCELALKPIVCNNRPIHSKYCGAGNTLSSAHLQSRLGKHPLAAHLVSRPGKTPTFRAPQSHLKSTPTSTSGFLEPPYKPAWPQETPYTTVGVFPVVSVPLYPMYQARAGIPFWLRGSTSTLRTLTNAV